MPGKMARSDPRAGARVTRGAGSSQHLASVLQEGRENANIDAGLGFIWRISDEHSSDGIRSVSPLPERKRQFAKPYPIRFDVREVLTVHPRCALVGAALGIGMGQDALSADLVVQGVEAVARRPDKLWRSASAGRHIAISFGVPWRPRGAQ